jgi:hypothetical protein
VLALHLNYTPGSYTPWVDDAISPLRPEEIAFKHDAQKWFDEEGAYWHVQATQPQTLGFALNDSPIGLAAWLIDKYRGWADCDGDVERRFSRDDLLAQVSLYWFTETIASSCRMYLENRKEPLPFQRGERLSMPCGVLRLAKEEPMPSRTWVERAYNVVRWTENARAVTLPLGKSRTSSPLTSASSYALSERKCRRTTDILSENREALRIDELGQPFVAEEPTIPCVFADP